MSSIKKLDGIVAQSSTKVSNQDREAIIIPSLEKFIKQFILSYHAWAGGEVQHNYWKISI